MARSSSTIAVSSCTAREPEGRPGFVSRETLAAFTFPRDLSPAESSRGAASLAGGHSGDGWRVVPSRGEHVGMQRGPSKSHISSFLAGSKAQMLLRV